MAKTFNSIHVKLTMSFGILVLIMSALSFFYTYTETKKAIKSITKNELQALASVIAASVDGETLKTIRPGDENTPKYRAISEMLYGMQEANQDIKYIYIYAHHDEKRVAFLVDAEYGHGKDVAKAGEIYEETTPAMLAGLNQADSENDFSSDRWGTFLSAYSPIRDKSGRSVGAVGVDMLSEKVMEKQNFIGDTIYIILAIGLVVAAILIAMFSIPMIRDIKTLDRAAIDMAKGNREISVKISRSDEIGELAESIKKLSEVINKKIN